MAKNSNDQLIVAKEYKEFFKNKFSEDGAISPGKKRTFFISYAHRDEEYKKELKNHFSGLVEKGLIESWDGRAIDPGDDWEDEIRKKLEEAAVVLFLISSDFMASDYIRDVEVKKTIERHNEGLVRIIPIIIRACDFKSLPLGKYQALPTGGKAISSWENKDEAYLNVVDGIKSILRSNKIK